MNINNIFNLKDRPMSILRSAFILISVFSLSVVTTDKSLHSSEPDLIKIILDYPPEYDLAESVKKWPKTGHARSDLFWTYYHPDPNRLVQFISHCQRIFLDPKTKSRVRVSGFKIRGDLIPKQNFALVNAVIHVQSEKIEVEGKDSGYMMVKILHNDTEKKLIQLIGQRGFAVPITAQIEEEYKLVGIEQIAGDKWKLILDDLTVKPPLSQGAPRQKALKELKCGETIRLAADNYKLTHIEPFNKQEKVQPWVIFEPVFDREVEVEPLE